MNLRGKIIVLSRIAAVTVLTLTAVFVFGGNKAVAAGNPELSFEGKLVTTAGVNIPDGNYNMEFKIYTGCTDNVGTGCTTAWTEDYLVSGGAGHYVTFTSGTFQVNLGSQTAFGGSVPWDTSPLYLSLEVGSTSSCTPAGNFHTNCTGDGVMSPYILLTSSPYAQDAGELGGLTSSQFGQLAANQTFTGTDIFQPTTNIPSVKIDQNSSGSFGQDVFDVQGSNGTSNFIQVTSTAANAGALNISALGGTTIGNAVTITAGTATGANSGGSIALDGGLASATAGSVGGAITLTAADGSTTGTGAAGGAVTILSGNGKGSAAENAGTVRIDTGTVITTGSATINIGNTNATAINIGNTSSTATTLNLDNGTGANAIAIGNAQTGGTIATGAALTTGTVTVGDSTSGTGAVTLQGEGVAETLTGSATTPTYVLNGVAATTYTVGAATTTGTIVIGGTAQTGALTLGSSSGTNAENIANGAGATTLDIADVQTGGAVNVGNALTTGTVTIGNTTAGTGAVTLQGEGVAETLTGSATTPTYVLNGVAATTYTVGAATTTGTISIGGASETGVNTIKAENITNTLTGSASSTASDVVQTLKNSPDAFDVINSDGETGISVDTTASTNYITDADFNSGNTACPSAATTYTAWTKIGSPTDFCVDSTAAQTYEGNQSLELVLAAVGEGAETITGTAGLTSNPPTTTSGADEFYTASFYVMGTNAATTAANFTITAVTAGGSPTCTGINANTGLGSTALSTTGFEEIYCDLTFSGDANDPITNLEITTNTVTTGTLYLNGVQLQLAIGAVVTATPSAFQKGNIQLGGIVNNPISFENVSNSNTAFQVENSAGTNVFSIDTLNDVAQIGSQVDNANPALLELNNYNSYTDPATTCTGTNNQGALYYNVVSDSIRGCIDGGWHDLMSTQGMGLLAFGIVENSGTAANAGDYPAFISAAIDGPCKVSWSSDTAVAIAPCVAYSGGRKVVVPQTTLTLTTTVADPWENVCLSGAGNQPTMVWSSTTSTTQTSAGDFPSWSAASPILCIATIHESSTTAGHFVGGTAGMIYDTRTFTDTEKVYQNAQVAVGTGYIAEVDTVGIQPSAAALLTANLEGVVVAYSGSTSATTPNAIIAISGPAEIVSTSGGGIDTGADYVESSATLGYGLATATAPAKAYESLGFSRTTTATGCTSAATCVGSIFLNLQDSY